MIWSTTSVAPTGTLRSRYTRAAFDFAVMLCCAVMMIVLAKIMAKLHGGNACPFGLNPYDGSSMGTAEQCHVVIVFGLIVLIIAGFFLVVELTFMYIGQIPRKSFWAMLELAMFVSDSSFPCCTCMHLASALRPAEHPCAQYCLYFARRCVCSL